MSGTTGSDPTTGPGASQQEGLPPGRGLQSPSYSFCYNKSPFFGQHPSPTSNKTGLGGVVGGTVGRTVGGTVGEIVRGTVGGIVGGTVGREQTKKRTK